MNSDTTPIDLNKKWLINWSEQWSSLFRECNWYDFTLIHIEFENDVQFGAYEGIVALLGLSLRIRYTHTVTEDQERFDKKSLADLDES